jgi:hypothetical protein
LSSLLRITETLGESGHDILPNLPFKGYVLTGFTFWKLAVNSEQLSVEPRTILLTLAFQQFKYESLHRKLRQVQKRMKPSGASIEPLQKAEESHSGAECSPCHMMVLLCLRQTLKRQWNTLICVHTMGHGIPCSQSIESIFDMTRTILRGDIGWEK